MQYRLQPSPSFQLPSSHCSLPARTPSPQTGAAGLCGRFFALTPATTGSGSGSGSGISILATTGSGSGSERGGSSCTHSSVQYSELSHCSLLSCTPSPQRGSVQFSRHRSGSVSELSSPWSHCSLLSTFPSPQNGLGAEEVCSEEMASEELSSEDDEGGGGRAGRIRWRYYR